MGGQGEEKKETRAREQRRRHAHPSGQDDAHDTAAVPRAPLADISAAVPRAPLADISARTH